MRCIYCNTPLAAIDYCPGCGADITIQKRIVRISNLLYNDGLEKARVRDIEGAITCLKRSLKFNKGNIDARNLLGLCYFEVGEAVNALCEWVISKNLQKEENLADDYINLLQNNKNRLDTINQTIRKYNQSLMYCREDNDDMAIIQLKRVVSQNPNLVKAYQLLALLFIQRKEYERARRLLKKAAFIDSSNTITLRYLQEIEEATGRITDLSRRHRRYEKEPTEHLSGTLRYQSGTETIIQPTTFRDSSNIATFINIILGILLGGAIVWFLAVPASRQAISDEANRQVTSANTKLAAESVRVQELEEELESYQTQVSDAQQERDSASSQVDLYDNLMAVANLYISGDEESAADMLGTLDSEQFMENAQILYNTLSSAVQESQFEKYYNAGTIAYTQQDYQTAADNLAQAVAADPNRENSKHYDALLYLGMSYYYLGNTAKADDAFNQIVSYYPENASIVQGYISTSSENSNTQAEDLSGLGSQTTGETQDSQTGNNTGDSNTADADTSNEFRITITDSYNSQG